MEISIVPSQFLSVVLDETKRSKASASSSSQAALSLPVPPHSPKHENNCDYRLKTDVDKGSIKRKHSTTQDTHHSIGLSEQEKRDLTVRLPKVLLAECTVEIHRPIGGPRERRAVRPRFDARVSPIYTSSKDKRRYSDHLNIPGVQITRETPLNLSVQNSKSTPPNKLSSTSMSVLSKGYRQECNSKDNDYASTNAHDALQLIEAVYSDQDDEDSISRDDLLIGSQKLTNSKRKISRPVPNLIEVSSAARANLNNSQAVQNPAYSFFNPQPNFYSALTSNLESLPTREALANLSRSMLMTNDFPVLKSMVAATDQKYSFKCEHCPNVYPNRGALWQHSVATHSVEKTCQCNICGRKFYRNCSLALHLKSHSEEEYCACKECGKSFTRLINLERHMKVHSVSSDRYQCEHCDKSFPDRANLLRHSVCHGAASTQSRTHQCDTCGKSYKSKDHLDIHWQATHAAIACSICAKCFTSHSELARHESTIHPDRPGMTQPYSCEHCGKSYSQRADLRKHLISHTGERLCCSTCGIEFTQRSSLLRHVKRMHANARQQHDRNPEAVLANEKLRKLIGLDTASNSSGVIYRNVDQIKKSQTINALIARLNSSGQARNTENPTIEDSKEIISQSVGSRKISNQDDKIQNVLSGCSLMNSNTLPENLYNANPSMTSLLKQKMLQLTPNSNLNAAAEFLMQLESSIVSSPLVASLNLNRNALFTNRLVSASNNMAFAATDLLSNDVSVSEENSVDDSLDDDDDNDDDDSGDYSEHEDGGEKTSNRSSYNIKNYEGNKYLADINDNEDSDNDNFVIDEEAVGNVEECYGPINDTDVTLKNNQDLNSDDDLLSRYTNAGQNIDDSPIQSDEDDDDDD